LREATSNPHRIVVLKSLADAGQRVPHLDADFLQQVGIANAGNLHQMR
jgi:hypothetical protein